MEGWREKPTHTRMEKYMQGDAQRHMNDENYLVNLVNHCIEIFTKVCIKGMCAKTRRGGVIDRH